jgi:hypothetical protein
MSTVIENGRFEVRDPVVPTQIFYSAEGANWRGTRVT